MFYSKLVKCQSDLLLLRIFYIYNLVNKKSCVASLKVALLCQVSLREPIFAQGLSIPGLLVLVTY